MSYSDDIRQFHIAYERIKAKPCDVNEEIKSNQKKIFQLGFPYKNIEEIKPMVFRITS